MWPYPCILPVQHHQDTFSHMQPSYFSFLFKNIYLFTWLPQVLVVVCGIFSGGMFNLVP